MKKKRSKLFLQRAPEAIGTEQRLVACFGKAFLDVIFGNDPVPEKGIRSYQPTLAMELESSQSGFLAGVSSATDRGMYWLVATLLCSAYQRSSRSVAEVTRQDLNVAADSPVTESLLRCLVLKYIQDWHEKGWFTPQLALAAVQRPASVMVGAFSRAQLRLSFCERPKTQASVCTSEGDRGVTAAPTETAPGEPIPGLDELYDRFVSIFVEKSEKENTDHKKLKELGYEVAFLPLRVKGTYAVPFVDIFPLLHSDTLEVSPKSLLHDYPSMQDRILNCPFEELTRLVEAVQPHPNNLNKGRT